MQKELAELLADALEGEVREDYSGRGMYGGTTTGVVFEGRPEDVCSVLLNEAGAVHQLQKDGVLSDVEPTFRFDNMGMDIIVY